MTRMFALPLLVFACDSDSTSSGTTEVRELPSPDCHDVAPSTRKVTPDARGATGTQATGGTVRDGRYEAIRVSYNQAPPGGYSEETASTWVVRGTTIFEVRTDGKRLTYQFSPNDDGKQLTLKKRCGDLPQQLEGGFPLKFTETTSGFIVGNSVIETEYTRN